MKKILSIVVISLLVGTMFVGTNWFVGESKAERSASEPFGDAVPTMVKPNSPSDANTLGHTTHAYNRGYRESVVASKTIDLTPEDRDTTIIDGGSSGNAFATTASATTTQAASWTIIAYLDGDNNLEGYEIQDFLQMAKVGSTSQVNVVVGMDRAKGYDTSYGNWTDTKIFYVTKGMEPTPENALYDVGEADMGDPNALSAFTEWSMNTYPAQHYVLVVDDHGGAFTGAAWDEDTGQNLLRDHLTAPEIRSALSKVYNDTGNKVDVMLFDACMMSSIEIVAEVYGYADYLVGSETIGWTVTFDIYEPLLNYLNANPDASPHDVAYTIIADAHPYDNTSYETQAISAIDVNQAYWTAYYIEYLSEEMINKMSTYKAQIETARNHTHSFMGPYDGTKNKLIDIYEFAYYVKMYVDDSTIQYYAQKLMDSYANTVINFKNTQTVSYTHGINTYFPYPVDTVDTGPPFLPQIGLANIYEHTHYAQWLSWDDFLISFYS